MASTGLIIGVVALGGGALWLYFRQKRAVKQPSACDDVCKTAGTPGEPCVSVCKGLGGFLGGLSHDNSLNEVFGGPHRDDRPKFWAEAARRQKINDQLNGPAAVERLQSPAFQLGGDPLYLTSSVLRYRNGCEPYFGAPGWGNCKDGTLDMYGDAVNAASGAHVNLSAVVPKARAYDSLDARRADNEASCQADAFSSAKPPCYDTDKTVNARSDYFLSGHPALDVTTTGPVVDDDGSTFWWVRGEKVTCPQGQAPSVVVLANHGQAGVGPGFALQLDDIPSNECTGSTGAPTGQPVSSTTYAGCPTPSGFTWDRTSDGTWFLRRRQVGEGVNDGPCAQSGSAQVAEYGGHFA